METIIQRLSLGEWGNSLAIRAAILLSLCLLLAFVAGAGLAHWKNRCQEGVAGRPWHAARRGLLTAVVLSLVGTVGYSVTVSWQWRALWKVNSAEGPETAVVAPAASAPTVSASTGWEELGTPSAEPSVTTAITAKPSLSKHLISFAVLASVVGVYMLLIRALMQPNPSEGFGEQQMKDYPVT